jgi:hypothetical protein
MLREPRLVDPGVFVVLKRSVGDRDRIVLSASKRLSPVLAGFFALRGLPLPLVHLRICWLQHLFAPA